MGAARRHNARRLRALWIGGFRIPVAYLAATICAIGCLAFFAARPAPSRSKILAPPQPPTTPSSTTTSSTSSSTTTAADLPIATQQSDKAPAPAAVLGQLGRKPRRWQPAVILICYKRPHYLQKALESLFQTQGIDKFAVYISQDGKHEPTAQVASAFATKHGATHWQRERIAQLPNQNEGQQWLAQHYKHALDRVFKEQGHSHAIILEEDMVLAPDFLLFFEQLGWLLDEDPTLWCVSSWHDNGFEHLVDKQTQRSSLFRTDYFPGLGWMLRKELWEELSAGFPKQHWDHWMRLDSVAKGRDCIVPLVSRNFNIGVSGANMQAHDYEKYLKKITVNDELVDLGDTSYLLNEAYEEHMQQLFERAEGNQLDLFTVPSSVTAQEGKVYLYVYPIEYFGSLAGNFKIWNVPRSIHRHAQVLQYQGNTFLLADARECPYLSEAKRIRRPQQLQLLKGQKGESCTERCSRDGRGLKCATEHFAWANNVAELTKHFPCENGFATVVGPDIPNYVDAPKNEFHLKCLITEMNPQCGAHHKDTQRLCPCLP